MSLIYILNFLLLTNLSSADTTSLCMTRIKSSTITESKRGDFCKCWDKNLSLLDEKAKKIVARWAKNEINLEKFESEDYELSEFVLRVESQCLISSDYLIEQLSTRKVDAVKSTSPKKGKD